MFFYYHRKFEEYLQFFSYLLRDLPLITKNWRKCIINKGHDWFSQATFGRTNAWTALYPLITTHMISAFFEFRYIYSWFFTIDSNICCYPCTLLIILWSLTARNKHRFLNIHFELLQFWRRYNYFSLFSHSILERLYYTKTCSLFSNKGRPNKDKEISFDWAVRCH